MNKPAVLYFATGSDNKFAEAQMFLPHIKQARIDLPEIQSLNPEEIIREKLQHAVEQYDVACIMVEDTSLVMRCLNTLPGPLVKWFLKALGGPQGLWWLADRLGDYVAIATTMIGYRDEQGGTTLFRGDVHGTIVKPRGDQNFSWDTIFQPDEHDQTFAEMTTDQKNLISHRGIALMELRVHLDKQIFGRWD